MIELPPRAPRKRVEIDIMKESLVALAKIPGVRAMRNNVGCIEDIRGIPVTFGLGEGSPDLVGVISFGGTESTLPALAELAPLAFAFAIEVKLPQRYASRKQKAWAIVARRRGVHVGLCRSAEESRLFVLGLRNHYSALLRALGRAMG